MANASIAQGVTRDAFTAAVHQARHKAAHDDRWVRAINRAEVNMTTQRWYFDGDILKVHTSQATGDTGDLGKMYTVTAHGCDCRAGDHGIPCWHRAARCLLVNAAQIANQPQALTCPTCHSALDTRQYYVGGRGYVYVTVCSNEPRHFSRPA